MESMMLIVALWVVLVGALVVPAYVSYEQPPEVLSSQTVALDLSEFMFSESEIAIGPGTDLTFKLVNVGDSQHNFGRSDNDLTERIKPGESDVFEAGVLTSDTVFFCLIPGHRESGMELTVSVSGT